LHSQVNAFLPPYNTAAIASGNFRDPSLPSRPATNLFDNPTTPTESLPNHRDMGFYLRKSIKVGPFRLNLSKSGIGISGGIPGFRIGSGPRGNYVHMGRGGLYYRKTLGGNGSSQRSGSGSSHGQAPALPPPPIADLIEIDSADVSQMRPCSALDLLQEIEEKSRLHRLGPWVLAAGLALILWPISIGLPLPIPLGLSILVATTAFFAFQHDAVRKTVVLFYEFDAAAEQAYEALQAAAAGLTQCAGVWHLPSSGTIQEARYFGGASAAVHMTPIQIQISPAPFLKSNISTVVIPVGRQILYFFPDRLLVRDGERLGAVDYSELSVQVSESRLMTDNVLPDTQVVDHHWQFANKDGSPDRRFSNNRQIPICLHEQIHLKSASGLNEAIQVSRPGVGNAFQQAIAQLAGITKG
jgi:hypothetical protein